MKYDVIIQLDDYRENIGALSKFDSIVKLLDKDKIQYVIIKVPAWIDMDPLENQNEQQFNDQELGLKYDLCNWPFVSLNGQRIYSCSYQGYGIEAEVLEDSNLDENSLDLRKVHEKAVLLEFRMGYTDRGYVDLCRQCPGHDMINTSAIPAAVQVSRKKCGD